MAQLFGDERRRTAAILEFLATTEVGVERTTEDGSCGSGGSRGRVAEAGRGRERKEDGPKARTRSRSPGYDVTKFFCTFYRGERRVGEEASSAGYGREVGKRLYLCHGRKAAVYMQYEEKQIKMWGSILRRAGYRAKAGKQDMDGFEGRLRAEGTWNEAERPEGERGRSRGRNHHHVATFRCTMVDAEVPSAGYGKEVGLLM
jgi:hypothetical protein